MGSYTLRIPVRTLGKEPITALDASPPFDVEGLSVRLRASPPYLVAMIDGFPTEGAALAFVPRVVVGLWSLVVRWNVAFRANFVPQRVGSAEDPVLTGNNLARSFGEDSGPPVEGLANAADTVVYPTGARMRWFGFGDASGVVQTPASLALPAFIEGVRNSELVALPADEKFKTAIELFNACFYETSLRARFLTLMTVLEVLAPATEKHRAAVTLIEKWKDELRRALADPIDSDAEGALESLDRELDFRRETSIRQRLRLLVRNQFTFLADADRAEVERRVVRAYDARGVLVHTGTLADTKLDAVHQTAFEAARRLLGSRLGLREF